jgi:hypothetical protein
MDLEERFESYYQSEEGERFDLPDGTKRWWGEWIAPNEMIWNHTGMRLIPFLGYKEPDVSVPPVECYYLSWFARLRIYIANLIYKHAPVTITEHLECNTHRVLLMNHKRVARIRYEAGLPPKFWIRPGHHLFWDAKQQKSVVVQGD